MDVLIVEDQAQARSAMGEILHQAGYTCHAVENGLAALAAVQESRYRAIICDLGLPLVDGVEQDTRAGGQQCLCRSRGGALLCRAVWAGLLGFLEFERSPDGMVDLKASIGSRWGDAHTYGGFRIGQMHAVNEWGVAGFDRHISVNDIPPISGGIMAAIPFAFDMAVGAEGYVVTGSNGLSAQVTNGIDRAGGVAPGGPGPARDVALIDQSWCMGT